MKKDAIVVLDIGKTNKKVLVYDKQLRVVDKVAKAFGEITDDNGLQLEQPEAVFQWFLEQLKHFAKSFSINAISVTTHGAMGVCVDADGNITCPPLAYTNQPGSEFCDSFFEEFGSRETLQSQTATAEIGEMINFAKIIYYWKQNCPDKLDASKHILYYPQYFGYKLTGAATADHTMLGCHTYLYDPKTHSYSDIASKLGVIDKLPTKVCDSWDVIGTVTPKIAEQCDLPAGCVVTAGVHDSNASLLPFLITETEDFVLNSTGTWCVAMKPAEDISFKDEELGKTVFFNTDVFGKPVKTSIFMGGLEYETYTKLLAEIHDRTDLPELDKELYQSLFDKCSAFILPSVIKGAGLFPQSKPRVIDGDTCVSLEDFDTKHKELDFTSDYDLAIAALISSLVIQTSLALDFTGYKDGGQIFVEGGFRLNQPYLDLLTALYPNSKIYRTNINEATALGSAILALSAIEGKQPHKLNIDLDIEKISVENICGLNMDAYKKKFFELI